MFILSNCHKPLYVGYSASKADKNRHHISIKLESIDQDFPIIEEYEFNVPNIYTSCYCTCQGLNHLDENQCDYGSFAGASENTTDVKVSFNKTLNTGICKGWYPNYFFKS